MILVNTFSPNRWRPVSRDMRPWVVSVIQFVEAYDMGKIPQVRFDRLAIGEQFWEAHPEYGWKHWTKISKSVASAFRMTMTGRQHNVFVQFAPGHKVVRSGHLEES